jgi:hypothetical protein
MGASNVYCRQLLDELQGEKVESVEANPGVLKADMLSSGMMTMIFFVGFCFFFKF